MKPTIKILDSIHCKANREARDLIIPLLKYERVIWKRSLFGHKAPVVVTSHLITGRSGSGGTFLTGLLPKIRKKFKNKIKIIGKEESIRPNKTPRLKGITFREDQSKALKAVEENHRGTFIMPTGSGKTVIIMGIISMFSMHRILLLCHTKELLSQTAEEIKKHLGVDPYLVGDGNKPNWKAIKEDENPIVLAIDKSFSNVPIEKRINFFDVTIIDECHHCGDLNNLYGQIMTNNLSPIKYGFTATKPTNKYGLLVNEGLLGPTIATLTVQEGIKIGIISRPIIKLIPVPFQPEINIACGTSYEKYYKYGIVQNRKRNIAILNEVRNNIKKDETTLIVIERTEHGKIIEKILKSKNIKVKFVQGSSSREKRKRTKKNLKTGKLKVAICTKIWREAINIPTLNNIINACGMKEEKMVIQAIGRGLRTSKNKKVVNVVDFLDPYRHLAEHSILRMQVYVRQGWL